MTETKTTITATKGFVRAGISIPRGAVLEADEIRPAIPGVRDRVAVVMVKDTFGEPRRIGILGFTIGGGAK